MTDAAPAPTTKSDAASALVSWVNGYLVPWRSFRDTTHKSDWDLFYRMWRSMWDQSDKNRKSERSQLVSPGTMQAVDSTVSEIEEAVFGQEQWFEVDEDLDEIKDPAQRDELIAARDRLREKFEDYKVPSSVAKCVLIGAIYGTGIGKINVDTDDYRYLVKDPSTGVMSPKTREQVCVELIPLEPYEFIPDPTTDCIDEMLGAAHETLVPLHRIKKGVKDGKYRDVKVVSYSGADAEFGKLNGLSSLAGKSAGLITEWHGLVPAKYLLPLSDPNMSDDERAMYEDMDEDESLVEAIVTILNKSELLEAKPNPFFMKDRAFISYQHDTVPGYFWGRGVPEKALNSQKAKDAELRSRIDALAFISAPMLAGDVTRLPRGFNLGVHPGKFWPTTGAPGESITAFRFGDLNASTFQQSAELDTMLQGATGAMDPITAFGSGQGPTDRGMASSALIKRSKRALKNFGREFLQPLVRKAMWRYVQFDANSFPQDYQFRVKDTMGVMAREIEAQQDIQLLSVVPNESPAFMVLLKNIAENKSSPSKGELISAIDKMLAPPDEAAVAKQQQQEQLQMRAQVAAVMEAEGKAAKAHADAMLAEAKAADIPQQTQLEHEKVQSDMIGHAIDLKEANSFAGQVEVSQVMTRLRASEIALKAIQTQISADKLKLEARKIEKTGTT